MELKIVNVQEGHFFCNLLKLGSFLPEIYDLAQRPILLTIKKVKAIFREDFWPGRIILSPGTEKDLLTKLQYEFVPL